MRNRIKKSVVAAAVGVASLWVLGGTADAEPATGSSWSMSYAAWDEAGGVSIYEKAAKRGTDEYIQGQFRALGDTVTIWDFHRNDRPAIVKLWIGDSGPTMFYAAGDGTKREVNVSADEGQTVYLQACTSASPNAVCTPRVAEGRT